MSHRYFMLFGWQHKRPSRFSSAGTLPQLSLSNWRPFWEPLVGFGTDDIDSANRLVAAAVTGSLDGIGHTSQSFLSYLGITESMAAKLTGYDFVFDRSELIYEDVRVLIRHAHIAVVVWAGCVIQSPDGSFPSGPIRILPPRYDILFGDLRLTVKKLVGREPNIQECVATLPLYPADWIGGDPPSIFEALEVARVG